MKSNRLTGIEAGRGVAALLVVGVHTRDHLFKNFHLPVPIGDLFVFGHAGVDFFFVLSGFIILYVHANDIGRPDRLSHYLQRRFTRIYPFYWIALLLTIAALSVSTSRLFPSISHLASSALLLPLPHEPIVPVAWTLQNEVTFYTVFSFLIWNRRLGLGLLAAWLGLLLWNLGGAVDIGPILAPFDLEFFFGMGAAWILRRVTVPLPWIALSIGIIVFFTNGYAEDIGIMPSQSTITHTVYAVGAMLVILGLVELERQNRLYVPRIMVALGGASYAIYLTHLLAIGAVWQVMYRTRLDNFLPLWLQFVTLFVCGTAIGWVLSRTIERPAVSLSRRLIGRWAMHRQLVGGGG